MLRKLLAPLIVAFVATTSMAPASRAADEPAAKVIDPHDITVPPIPRATNEVDDDNDVKAFQGFYIPEEAEDDV